MRSACLAISMVVTLLPSGCRTNDSETRRQAKATADAERTAAEATVATTGAVARVTQGEMLTAFAWEQLDYRGRLQAEIETIDRHVAGLRRMRKLEKEARGHAVKRDDDGDSARRDERIRDLLARRDGLLVDIHTIERSSPQDWAETKAKVEHDLDSGIGAPPRDEE